VMKRRMMENTLSCRKKNDGWLLGVGHGLWWSRLCGWLVVTGSLGEEGEAETPC